MGKRRHWVWLTALLALWPQGCGQNLNQSPQGTPMVRVLLLENQQQVELTATAPTAARVGAGAPQQLSFSPGVAIPVTLSPSGWQVGNRNLGPGDLTFEPGGDGSLFLNKQAYRGRYRFVPTSPGHFDVVNMVDIEGYLKGVVAKEMWPTWHEEAYKAQAIVARTYALYESRTAGTGHTWDVYPDQRSQVYGGIGAESLKSRQAVEETTGIVIASGPAGRETIFKAYFSSCCGGVTQSAGDAFGDPNIPPLMDRMVGPQCIESPKFNWAPVVLTKVELTRRMRAWGGSKQQPVTGMAPIAKVEIMALNRWGRPSRFLITDSRGVRYGISGEDLRQAFNTDAGTGPRLFSSFFKPIDEGPSIRFADGHGFGHGVGLCQWCAEHQATNGVRHESIVLSAYPSAKLLRAY